MMSATLIHVEPAFVSADTNNCIQLRTWFQGAKVISLLNRAKLDRIFFRARKIMDMQTRKRAKSKKETRTSRTHEETDTLLKMTTQSSVSIWRNFRKKKKSKVEHRDWEEKPVNNTYEMKGVGCHPTPLCNPNHSLSPYHSSIHPPPPTLSSSTITWIVVSANLVRSSSTKLYAAAFQGVFFNSSSTRLHLDVLFLTSRQL